MQSFLTSFILTSVTLAAVSPQPTQQGQTDFCKQISLYRMRSKNPVNVFQTDEGSINVIDHVEVTNQDDYKNYEVERKIATICANQAVGTSPLYSYEIIPFHSNQSRIHFSILEISYSKQVVRKKRLGYVYTKSQGEGSHEIYSKRKEHKVNGEFKIATLLATEIKDEANTQGYSVNQVLFYSAP